MSRSPFDVLCAAIDAPVRGLAAKAVLVALARHADKSTGEAYPSIARLAACASCSETTAREALHRLEAGEWIERPPIDERRRAGGRQRARAPRGGRGVTYRVNLDMLDATVKPSGSRRASDAKPSGSRTPSPSGDEPQALRLPSKSPSDSEGRTASRTARGNSHHQPEPTADPTSAPTRTPATDPAGADGGGGESFDGDLQRAVEKLRAVGVSDPERHARRAGSERCIAWLIEETKTATNPAGAIVARINKGDRPPAGWRPKPTRDRLAWASSIVNTSHGPMTYDERFGRQPTTNGTHP